MSDGKTRFKVYSSVLDWLRGRVLVRMKAYVELLALILFLFMIAVACCIGVLLAVIHYIRKGVIKLMEMK